MLIAGNEDFIAEKNSHMVTVLLRDSVCPDKDKVRFTDKYSGIQLGEQTVLSISIGHVPQLIDILNKIYKGW